MRAIYPNSLFSRTEIDEHFFEEAAPLSEPPILYSVEEGRLTTRKFAVDDEVLLYRGWILTPVQYAQMEAAVRDAGGKLLISTEQYKRTQFGDGWLEHMEGITPRTSVLPYWASDAELLKQARILDCTKFVVKGASKSVKHDWDNSMYVDCVEDLLRVVKNFREHVSEAEESTLLLREFENWNAGELRLWWVDGKLAYNGLHPQSSANVDVATLEYFLPVLASRVAALDCPLLTTDLVRSAGGEWRVVEVGNGQVTEPSASFSETVRHTSLFENLY